MATFATTVAQIQEFLSGVATTEGRIVMSVVAVLLAGFVALVVFPFVSRRINRLVAEFLETGQVSKALVVFSEYVPRPMRVVIVRLVQLSVFFLAGIALLVIWGLVDTAWVVVEYLGNSTPIVVRSVLTFALGLLAYAASDQLKEAIDRVASQAAWMTDHQQEIVTRLGQLTVLAVFGMTVLTLWEVNLQGLLVGAGFLGIVVGLAARQALGSLIAGFVLMFSRPFTIGDWIEVGDEEGIVTEITIMNTRLENFDGEVVYLPNDRVNNQAIVNRSRRGSLRLRVDVGIDYEADPQRAKEIAMETIKSIDVIVDGPPPQIVPKSFGDSAVVLEMRFWIDHPTPPRKWNAIENVVTAVKAAFEREGIKIPFPQRELSGRAETGGFHVQGAHSSAEFDGTPGERS